MPLSMNKIYAWGLVCTLSLIFLSTSSMQAQLSAGGTPMSFILHDQVAPAPDAIDMAPVDVARLRAEDAINDRDFTKPHRFGKQIEVGMNPENSGVWEELPGGDRLWRVTVRSFGAQTINMIFSRYKLPEGAQLFIYNKDRSMVIGAFTHANNQPEEVLGTTLVDGDEMVVEYYEPAWVAFPGEVEIGSIVHGYRLPGDGEQEQDGEGRAFGDSGNCHNNVNCPSGSAWANQKRSVVRIVNGGDWCTGALINTANNSGLPYLLTANHCYAASYATWVFWFNFEASGCTNPASSPTNYTTLSGSTLKSRNAASDFMLLQLNSTPGAAQTPYYAGWNRGTTAPTSSVCIHHPSGDIKKISFDNNAATNSSWSGTPANSHWHVIWDSGVTEPGSSGSPLFDQNQRIIGQLHGGASVCGGSDLSDEYGKFSVSWNTGTTSATRLSDWLDPGSSGATTANGYDPFAGGANFLTVSPSNQNVTAAAGSTAFSVSSNVSWTASTTATWITLSPASGTNNGTVTATYTANGTTSSRVGTITITGGGFTQNVTVTQAGTTGACSNDGETANNSRTTAPTIALNTNKLSQIGSSTDVDWWKFTLSATTTVTLTLSTLPADFDLQLRRSNGNVISTSQNGSTLNETITATLAAGTYYAYVYGYNGAFSTSVCYTLRVGTTALQGGHTDKHLDETSVSIAPNPTNGLTTLRLSDASDARVLVYDQIGRKVMEQNGREQFELNFANLPGGTYIIRVETGGKTLVERVIVGK